MTKEMVVDRLLSGEKIEAILHIIGGQDCWIYKDSKGFHEGNDVIYIPDIDLNGINDIGQMWADGELVYKEAVEELSSAMYTGDEIFSICGMNWDLANDLFDYLDWQHPISAILDYQVDLDDDDWIRLFGQTPDEIWPEEKKT